MIKCLCVCVSKVRNQVRPVHYLYRNMYELCVPISWLLSVQVTLKLARSTSSILYSVWTSFAPGNERHLVEIIIQEHVYLLHSLAKQGDNALASVCPSVCPWTLSKSKELFAKKCTWLASTCPSVHGLTDNLADAVDQLLILSYVLKNALPVSAAGKLARE